MKKTIISACIALLLSNSIFAKTIAIVNNEKIDSSKVETYAPIIDRFIPLLTGSITLDNLDNKTKITVLAEASLNFLIIKALAAQEAKRLHLDEDPKIKSLLDKERENLNAAKQQNPDRAASLQKRWHEFEEIVLLEAYISSIVSKELDEQKVQQYYNELSRYYSNIDGVDIVTIATNTKAQAQAAIKELAKTKDIDSVMKKYSQADINPYKQYLMRNLLTKYLSHFREINFGSLNQATERQYDQAGLYFTAGGYLPIPFIKQYFPDIYATIAHLKKGQANIFHTKVDNGDDIYMVLYIKDRQKIKLKPLDQIKDEFKEYVMQQILLGEFYKLAHKSTIIYTQEPSE